MPTEAARARRWALLCFLLMTLIWGSTWFAIHLQLNGTPPFVSVALRFLLAAAVIGLWMRWRGEGFQLPRRQWPLVAVQGATIYGFNYLFAYASTQYIVSGLVALVFALNVMVSLLLEPFVLGRRSPPRVWLAVGIGLLGLAIVLAPDISGGEAGRVVLGVLLAFGGAALVGAGGVLSARLMEQGAAISRLNFYGFLSGSLIALTAAWVQGDPLQVQWSLAYVLSLLHLSLVGSVAAFALYLVVVREMGAVRAGYSSVITPIIALLLSGLWEGLQWSLPLLLGGLLILLGNGLILSARGQPR